MFDTSYTYKYFIVITCKLRLTLHISYVDVTQWRRVPNIKSIDCYNYHGFNELNVA